MYIGNRNSAKSGVKQCTMHNRHVVLLAVEVSSSTSKLRYSNILPPVGQHKVCPFSRIGT